jgi:hypothetical protein
MGTGSSGADNVRADSGDLEVEPELLSVMEEAKSKCNVIVCPRGFRITPRVIHNRENSSGALGEIWMQ